jgi:hypothetical protein
MGVFKIADESATTVFGQSLPLNVFIRGLRLPKNATTFFGLNFAYPLCPYQPYLLIERNRVSAHSILIQTH